MFAELVVELHGLPRGFDPQEIRKRVKEALSDEFLPEYDSDIDVEVTCTAGAKESVEAKPC